MIQFDQVEVTYGDFKALPDFNLTIKDGEFFTLLGPSGCGKSTALRTLAGFIQPSSGQIWSEDRDISRLHSSKRGIGMVFQNYALFPSMTVRENIGFGLKIAKVSKSKIEARVAEVGSQVNLTEEQMDKGIAELSGGQQQRVAIARALVMQPDVLLLDEPLSNLDAKLRQQLRIQLKQLQLSAGITTVYVTHDQEEALSMSDRIAVLNKGRIEQIGTPEALYNNSATEFVCNFLGEVNRLNDQTVNELNQQGANLDQRQNHYIRLEKIRVNADGTPNPEPLVIPSTVVSRQYQGSTAVYTLNAPGGTLLALRMENDGRVFEAEHPVTIGINPKWILSFDQEETNERL